MPPADHAPPRGHRRHRPDGPRRPRHLGRGLHPHQDHSPLAPARGASRERRLCAGKRRAYTHRTGFRRAGSSRDGGRTPTSSRGTTMSGNGPSSLRRAGDERKIQLGKGANTLENMQSDRPRYALRFISGKYQGGEFPLRMNREIIIGRSSDLDMVLVEDMVSRRHAKISSTDTEVYIQDMGSTNGTFVNGEKIAGRALLHEGDRILVGKIG